MYHVAVLENLTLTGVTLSPERVWVNMIVLWMIFVIYNAVRTCIFDTNLLWRMALPVKTVKKSASGVRAALAGVVYNDFDEDVLVYRHAFLVRSTIALAATALGPLAWGALPERSRILGSQAGWLSWLHVAAQVGIGIAGCKVLQFRDKQIRHHWGRRSVDIEENVRIEQSDEEVEAGDMNAILKGDGRIMVLHAAFLVLAGTSVLCYVMHHIFFPEFLHIFHIPVFIPGGNVTWPLVSTTNVSATVQKVLETSV